MLHDEPLKALQARIIDVPDFPKPGIVFKDITPLLADPATLALAVELMANPFRGHRVDAVIGAESRGFIFGTAVAQCLSAGFIPARKPGKLPRPVHAVEYELEYGRDRLEIHADAMRPGMRVVLIDDLLATGGTMRACCELVRNQGAEIVGMTALVELTALGGRARINGYGPFRSVVAY